jgi:isopenicillin N synthase-like dioxygenase
MSEANRALALGGGLTLAAVLYAVYKRVLTRTDASTDAIPIFDLAPFLEGKPDADTCRAMAEYLRRTSILVVRDPRVSADDSAAFTAQMQRYYAQPKDALMEDARPEAAYQVGVTPENVECAKCAKDPRCLKEIDAMPEAHRPHKPTKADPKWRFFWRVGPRPATSEFPEQNLQPVCPRAFPDWATTMDTWGAKMLGALETSAEMLALGFGLPHGALRELMRHGPHLLAPTGSDLSEHSAVGTVFAGWHTDLNFLTIHGKSTFPGLYVWLRDGSRMAVKVPPGCLLIQAGQQMEYVMGGHVTAGYHEVVVNEATRAAMATAKAEGRSLWRVSTTMFGTVRSDATLQPFARFADEPGVRAGKYPPIKAGQQVLNELMAIGMADELKN